MASNFRIGRNQVPYNKLSSLSQGSGSSDTSFLTSFVNAQPKMDKINSLLKYGMGILLLLLMAAVLMAYGSSYETGPERTAPSTCGYTSCSTGKAGMLNVHVVSHTHDDVGWLKTVDQYYYGSKNNVQNAGVQYILDSVIQALTKDPSRKFTYVETAFFWRWWQEQQKDIQDNVRTLVNQGRLTFTNGAWSMNDEASTHYSSLIENFSWGLRRLNDTFGMCGRPTVGWQIDPFGHSREHASLLAQVGFDGLFLGRVDYQDKQNRETNRTMEMVWRTSDSLGNSADLFNGILPNGYSPPSSFCFDTLCQDAPVMDDPRLNDYNVNERVDTFLTGIKSQAKHYTTNHLIVTMGEDFNYQNAEQWFKNLDRLIKYVNALQVNGSKVNLLYSTPACYLYALNQANITWPVKSDDFFPYASGAHSYWTGYFTSRPALKRFEREASTFLHACKQISALAQQGPDSNEKVTILREALGVAQHHDAVAGTEKQNVAEDYALRLDQGIKACQAVVADGLKKLSKLPPSLSVQYCDLLNISQCEVTENNRNVLLVLWNAMGKQVQQYVHIPVPDGNYQVTDSTGAQIPFQITPLFKGFMSVAGRTSKSTQELVFYVTLPATGSASYGIQRSVTQERPSKNLAKVQAKTHDGDDIVFQNDYLTAIFDFPTGLLKSIVNQQTKDVLTINQTFGYYSGFSGNNSAEELRASGAYVFRPNCTGTAAQCRTIIAGNGTYEVVQGSLVQEIRQYFDDWSAQIIRLYAKSNFLEFEWQIGPIPVSDAVGKEIVSLFSTDLSTNKTFYTDSNGRENMKRIRDFRPTFDVNLTEPLSSNYYPVTSRIFLRDEQKKTQLTVLTDRAQGGSSLQDGQLELMIHRRLLHDDAFGVGEPLNEPGFGQGLIVRGKHYLTFSPIGAAAANYRLLEQQLYWHPTFAFIPARQQALRFQSSPLAPAPLPDNINLVSLEQWTNSSLVIRLAHLFEVNEDPVLSQPASVDLQQILGSIQIVSVQEMALDANVPLSSFSRLKWKKANGETTCGSPIRAPVQGFNVTINPMELRTFLVQL